MRMSMEDWLRSPAVHARARYRVFDVDGAFAKRGDIGEVCDYLPNETSADGYVVVDFPATGPVLCWPHEVEPA